MSMMQCISLEVRVPLEMNINFLLMTWGWVLCVDILVSFVDYFDAGCLLRWQIDSGGVVGGGPSVRLLSGFFFVVHQHTAAKKCNV